MKYKLEDVFKFIRNGANIKQGGQEGYPITRIETIAHREVDRTKMGYADIFDISNFEKYILNEGDILMSHINSEKHLGKVAIYESHHEDEKIIHGMNLLCLRPNVERVHPKYIYHYFNSSNFARELNKIIKHSVNQSSFAIRDIKKLRIQLPPMNMQIKIAIILDKAQLMINKRQQQIEAISLLQQSIYNKMFMEKQNDQSEVLLKDVCSINPRKSEIEEELHDLEISFIPMVSVSEDGDIDLNESRILKEVYRNYTYFAENDILFAKITPCMENGKGAIARGLQNKIGFGSSEFHVLRPKKGTTPEWVYFLTKSKKFRKTAEENMTGSAGQKRVPRKFLENYPVMLPSKSKQEEFKNIYYKTEKNKQVLNESLRELEKLNASLLQKAFNGELFNNKVNI